LSLFFSYLHKHNQSKKMYQNQKLGKAQTN